MSKQLTKRRHATFADQLIAQGVKFPSDTVIFEATDVLTWVEDRMSSGGANEVTAIFDEKRTLPVYPNCFVEAHVENIYAGMYLCEAPIETIRAHSDHTKFIGLDFAAMKYDEVKRIASATPTSEQAQNMDQMLENAFKFFLLLPLNDYGWGFEAVNAAMGAIFDGYGVLTSIVADSVMGGYVDEIYQQIGVTVKRDKAVLPVSALWMALVAMSHVHHRGEVELVTHPRHIVRQHQRETGKAPSPFFRLIRPNQPQKVYTSDGHSGRTLKQHWVSGHFRTVIDHPIEWFNGTKFIKTHERGKGRAGDDRAPRYQIRLD